MARGGSRIGAGRPGWRRKCEQSMAFDIREVVRRGLLKLGQRFSWHWQSSGDCIGSMSVRVGSDHVTLSFRRIEHDASREIDSTLWIEPCAGHYGSRRMFVCPRCGMRCAIVYFGSGTCACRRCLRLGYASEAENAIGRLWRKQGKLERRLAAGADEWNGWKPKGMHWTTFDRLAAKIEQIERQKHRGFAVQARATWVAVRG
jgi:hypothetical protein